MLEAYKKIYEEKLRWCKRLYNPQKPYENLDECCDRCNRTQWELLGMLEFINECGEITYDQVDKEWEKILEDFSTIKLFHAHREVGEVMVFEKIGE